MNTPLRELLIIMEPLAAVGRNMEQKAGGGWTTTLESGSKYSIGSGVEFSNERLVDFAVMHNHLRFFMNDLDDTLSKVSDLPWRVMKGGEALADAGDHYGWVRIVDASDKIIAEWITGKEVPQARVIVDVVNMCMDWPEKE